MSDDDIRTAVITATAEALALDESDVTLSSTLLGDLGAESIDLLDILFRVEQSTGLKVQAGDLADHVQGGIPDDEFGDADGFITPTGLAQLKRVMPQLDVDALTGRLEAEHVMGLFTVANLIDIVSARAGHHAAA
jgi:acyl carrier protein